ncbi:MAG: hypothetical protein V4546_05505 [Bacteroidota bacterium]
MTWTHFLLILLMIYLAYYGLNVLYDLVMARKLPAGENDQEVLFFNEENSPELITYEEEAEMPAQIAAPETAEAPAPNPSGFSSGMLRSTGAVGIKELFNLAKDDLIEYTRAIPY